MTPFLQALAELFVAEKAEELYRYRFFFQNKRAGLFFLFYIRKALERRAGSSPTSGGCGSIILPQTTTLPTYIRQVRQLPDEDVNSHLFLMNELFRLYRQYFQSSGSAEGLTAEAAQQAMESETEIRTLQEFFPLGERILADFNDMDLHLIDPEVICRHMRDLQELKEDPHEYYEESQLEALAKFLRESGSDQRRTDRFAKKSTIFWEQLPQLKRSFDHAIGERGWSYIGRLMREVLEEVKAQEESGAVIHEHPLWRDGVTNVFVGLNALSEVELGLLQAFQEHSDTYFYWDYDSPLLKALGDTSDQLKIKNFVVENPRRFPEPAVGDPLYLERPSEMHLPRVKVCAMPTRVGQVSYVSEWLEGFMKEAGAVEQLRNMRVALVLPDERMLLPVMSGLNAELLGTVYKEGELPSLVNITMGLPIVETPVVAMLLRLLHLQSLRQRRSGHRWKGEELLEVIAFNPLEGYWQEREEVQSIVGDKIRNDRLLFLSEQQLRELLAELPLHTEDRDLLSLILLLPTEDPLFLVSYIQEIIAYFLQHSAEDPLVIEEQAEESGEEQEVYTTALTAVLHKLAEVLQQQSDSLQRELDQERGVGVEWTSFDVQLDLLQTTLQQTRLPFAGEPLRGLQIIGMLETRNLDFDHVIVLDSTDGILPQNSQQIGLLPYALRASYGMPTYRWQEYTRAYNFFRLISRAREVTALYDLRRNDSAKGEPSRYLLQLKYLHPECKMEWQSAGFEYGDQLEAEEIRCEIDEARVAEYRAALQESSLHDSGEQQRRESLSPSVLRDFITCPLQFYFTRVIGIRETEKLKAELDAAKLGTVVHETIRKLYEKMEGHWLDKDDLWALLQEGDGRIQAAQEQCLKELMKVEVNNLSGLDLMEYTQVASQMIRNIIEKDATCKEQVQYLGGEKRLQLTYRYTSTSGEEKSIHLKGFIDRLDLIQEEDGSRYYRIIDYKTGGDKYDFGNLVTLFDCDDPRITVLNGAAVQLFFYAMILSVDSQSRACLGMTEATLPISPQMWKPREQMVAPFTWRYQRGKAQLLQFFNEQYPELGLDVPWGSVVQRSIHRLLDQLLSGEPKEVFRPNPRNGNACKYCIAQRACPYYEQATY